MTSTYQQSPSCQSKVWDDMSLDYDEVSCEFLGRFAEEGIKHLGLDNRWRALDLACGPGTVTLQIAPRVASVDALDFSQKMLDRLTINVEQAGHQNISAHHADGQCLPFPDNTFDCAISMFGLMFFPDRQLGLRELQRVLIPKKQALISSWAPAKLSPVVSHIQDVVRLMEPPQKMPQSDLSTLEDPKVFRAELEQAGFKNITIKQVERHLQFDHSDAYWEIISKGAVPLVTMRKRMEACQWKEKEELARNYLHDVLGGVTSLGSTAYLAYAEAK